MFECSDVVVSSGASARCFTVSNKHMLTACGSFYAVLIQGAIYWFEREIIH